MDTGIGEGGPQRAGQARLGWGPFGRRGSWVDLGLGVAVAAGFATVVVVVVAVGGRHRIVVVGDERGRAALSVIGVRVGGFALLLGIFASLLPYLDRGPASVRVGVGEGDRDRGGWQEVEVHPDVVPGPLDHPDYLGPRRADVARGDPLKALVDCGELTGDELNPQLERLGEGDNVRLLCVGVVSGSPGKGAENGNASIVRAALAAGGDGVKEAVAVSGDDVEINAEVPETLLRFGQREVATSAAGRARRGPRAAV